jgi:hypothetical protein
VPLLDTLFKAGGASAALPVITLSIADGNGVRVLWHSFSRLTVGSFGENLSGRLSGTATLIGRPG